MEVWGGFQAVSTSVTMPGLDAWVYAQPHQGQATGGDIHYLSSCATGRITRLMVADVSGHGQVVSATAASLRALMRKFINHADQRRAVESLNREFTHTEHSGRFATAILGTFWGPTCSLTLCNAGHPRPFWFRARDNSWRALDTEPTEPSPSTPAADGPVDVPLGVLDSTTYRQIEIPLHPSDLVFLYTDSLIEARLPSGALLGEPALLDILRSLPTSNPADLIPSLLQALTARGATLDDDVTALLLRPSGSLPLRSRFTALWHILTGALSPTKNSGLPELSRRSFGGFFLSRFNR